MAIAKNKGLTNPTFYDTLQYHKMGEIYAE